MNSPARKRGKPWAAGFLNERQDVATINADATAKTTSFHIPYLLEAAATTA